MIVKLSKQGIKDAIQKLEFLKDNIKVANTDIIQNLVNIGVAEASTINAMAIQSGAEKSQVIGRVVENGTKGYVVLTGPNAVYDEFGTGEEGLASPHPMHDTSSRPLNPYNSGPYVSTHIDYTGKHYWIYQPNAGIGNYDQSGKTYGIPAGKQIYNAAKEIKARKDDVTKTELNNAIRTINK